MNAPISSFDLDAYAARYKGRGKIQRLRFIAHRSPELAVDALRLAVTEALKGRDTALYKDILSQADGTLGPKFQFNQAWVSQCDSWAGKELEKLRHELEDNKQQANKEVIRTGHQDLGDFFHIRGRLSQARGEYIKTRDYCMHAQHNVHMCANVIHVSIEAGDYSHVESHYLMAENIPDVDKQSPELAKMRACAGLALLVRGNYAQAASRFLNVNTDTQEDRVAALAEVFGDVLSLEDLATYGALCALATLQRPALRKQVLDRPEFRTLLELVPDVREIVYDFYHTRYTRCLATMERVRADLALDLYLGRDDHVDALFRLIRRKAIVQYVSPFVTVDLSRMCTVFRASAAELESELLTLIESGMIDARIDTRSNALHRRRTAVRATAISAAVQKGQDAVDEVEAMLLRMTLMKTNAEITHGSALRPNSGLGPRGPSISSVVDTGLDPQFRHA